MAPHHSIPICLGDKASSIKLSSRTPCQSSHTPSPQARKQNPATKILRGPLLAHMRHRPWLDRCFTHAYWLKMALGSADMPRDENLPHAGYLCSCFGRTDQTNPLGFGSVRASLRQEDGPAIADPFFSVAGVRWRKCATHLSMTLCEVPSLGRRSVVAIWCCGEEIAPCWR